MGRRGKRLMGSHRPPCWRASRSLETKPLGARLVTLPLLTFGDKSSLSRGLSEASWSVEQDPRPLPTRGQLYPSTLM